MVTKGNFKTLGGGGGFLRCFPARPGGEERLKKKMTEKDLKREESAVEGISLMWDGGGEKGGRERGVRNGNVFCGGATLLVGDLWGPGVGCDVLVFPFHLKGDSL